MLGGEEEGEDEQTKQGSEGGACADRGVRKERDSSGRPYFTETVFRAMYLISTKAEIASSFRSLRHAGDPWARQSGEVEQGSHQVKACADSEFADGYDKFRQGVLASTRVPPFFYSLASPLLSPCPSHSRFTSLQVDAKHRMSSSEALDHP
eukprot:767359-Hanusia_phi.AAC.4